MVYRFSIAAQRDQHLSILLQQEGQHLALLMGYRA
jgi:hypothetical protein